MLKRKYALSAFAAAAAATVLTGCNVGKKQGDSSQPLHVGYQKSPAMALIMVAKDQGYFKDVALKEFTAGKFALQAFFAGSVDIAVAGDVPVNLGLHQGAKISVIGEVLKGSKNEIRMVVRYDGDCNTLNAQNYFAKKRRRVSTSFYGGPEYFAYTFLNSYEIAPEHVELISQKPEDMPTAIGKGNVDGVSIFEPFASQAESAIGPGKTCSFPDSGNYRQHYVIATTPALAENIDPRVEHFIAALRRAEEFLEHHPSEAKKIVSNETGLDIGSVGQIWDNYKFGVVLDQDNLRELWQRQQAWISEKAKHDGFPAKIIKPDYPNVMKPSYITTGYGRQP